MSVLPGHEDLQQQLFAAAAAGDCTAIRALARNGVDLNACNEKGFTALDLAARHNHLRTVMTIMSACELQKMQSRDTGSRDTTNFGQGNIRSVRAA